MKSIFKGEHVKKVYEFKSYLYKDAKIPYVILTTKVVNYETILETELDTPPLGSGDQFYLTKEDKIIRVESTLRGTDNVMVYLTDVVLSETEELEESLKVAIAKREEYLIKKEQSDKEYAKRQEARDYKEKYNDSFFVKRWFMTKPE